MAEALDAQTRVDELLFIAGHLIGILEKENAALVHNHFDVVNTLLDQKTKLSHAYEIRVLGFEHAEDPLEGIEPKIISELKAQGIRLQELITVNVRELKIGIETSKRFMDVLAQSVKNATFDVGTYGACGRTGPDASPQNRNAAALAIDENL